jgi:hypothetical protein
MMEDRMVAVEEFNADEIKRINSKMIGASGEFLVCGMLAQYRWAAAMTRDGIPMTDVLAEHSDTGRAISVQVKTTWVASGNANWQFGLNDIAPSKSETQWFVLVKLEGKEAPARARFFVVPKDHVAAGVWIVHQNWLTDPNAKPGTRNTSIGRARASQFVFEGYEDRWDFLKSNASEAPVLLPIEYKSLSQDSRVGLPPGHPWQTALPKWQ